MSTSADSAELAVEGPWNHRFVAANGARFHVTVAGPDERDTPLVVLLHDVLQYWWAWRHQLTALAAAGYRVAAMDLRGTGGSDKPPRGYDTPTMATDVTRVTRSLGAERCVLVGSGAGAHIAFAAAAMHPELVRGVASAELVVVASPTYKATYTGLLKLFLDALPHRGLEGIVALPVMLGAAPGHALAVETALRPVLHELGAPVPSSLFLLESAYDDPATYAAWGERTGPLVQALIHAVPTAPREKVA